MPIYVYAPSQAMPVSEEEASECCHFEILQKISDAPVAACPTCGAPVARAITTFGVKSVAGHVVGTARRTAEAAPPPAADSTSSRAAKLAMAHRCGMGCRH